MAEFEEVFDLLRMVKRNWNWIYSRWKEEREIGRKVGWWRLEGEMRGGRLTKRGIQNVHWLENVTYTWHNRF